MTGWPPHRAGTSPRRATSDGCRVQSGCRHTEYMPVVLSVDAACSLVFRPDVPCGTNPTGGDADPETQHRRHHAQRFHVKSNGWLPSGLAEAEHVPRPGSGTSTSGRKVAAPPEQPVPELSNCSHRRGNGTSIRSPRLRQLEVNPKGCVRVNRRGYVPWPKRSGRSHRGKGRAPPDRRRRCTRSIGGGGEHPTLAGHRSDQIGSVLPGAGGGRGSTALPADRLQKARAGRVGHGDFLAGRDRNRELRVFASLRTKSCDFCVISMSPLTISSTTIVTAVFLRLRSLISAAYSRSRSEIRLLYGSAPLGDEVRTPCRRRV